MKHPNSVPGWDGTLEELAQAVENMSYDKVVEFIHHLDMAILNRGLRDREAGKTQLATGLFQVSKRLGTARAYMEQVWKLCKPHMKND